MRLAGLRGMQAITKCCGALGSHVSVNLIQGPPGTGVLFLLKE